MASSQGSTGKNGISFSGGLARSRLHVAYAKGSASFEKNCSPFQSCQGRMVPDNPLGNLGLAY